MPIAYTNRKGKTYFLRQGVAKTGKTRYYFSSRPEGDLVEEVPEGYEISESVNGVVSLVKSHPSPLRDMEVHAVKVALASHPDARFYRLDVKGGRITIHEYAGSDPRELIHELAGSWAFSESRAAQIESEMLARGRFTPVMRFTLMEERTRHFKAERMCYLGSMEGWIGIAFDQPIEELARTLIPVLGSEEFFELH